MPTAADPFALARPPGGFKLYQARDGRFSERLGPYFVKGRGTELTMGLRILDRHANRNGVAHGGALMAFADTLCGNIAARAADYVSATVSLHSNFLRSVPLGAWVEGRARALRTGKRCIFMRAELAADGALAFTADGVWQRIDPRPRATAAAAQEEGIS